jgi:hypothetical protein
MSRLNSTLIAAVMLVASSAASAEVCKVVNKAAGTVAAGATVQALMSAGPVTAVAHSSGGLILTGASGYLANTLGFVAGAWAVATAPVTIAVVGTAAVTGLGVAVACHYMQPEGMPAKVGNARN